MLMVFIRRLPKHRSSYANVLHVDNVLGESSFDHERDGRCGMQGRPPLFAGFAGTPVPKLSMGRPAPSATVVPSRLEIPSRAIDHVFTACRGARHQRPEGISP